MNAPIIQPESPRQPARTRRVVGAVVFVLLLAAAAYAVRLATPTPPASSASSGHDHAATAASGSDSGPRAVSISAVDARRIGVTYAAVSREPVHSEVRAGGELRVDERRVHAVTSRVDGYVERLFVDFTGRTVRQGEPLLSLYSPTLVAAQEELFVASKLQRDVAGGSEEARTQASAMLEAVRRRLAAWGVGDAEIRAIESSGTVQRLVTLRAPASGVVLEKSVVDGQMITAGQPLLRVADLRELWLEGDVFEQDLPAVRVGATVTAEFRALAGAVRRGRISWVSPVLDPEARTARVRVILANADGALSPGMLATLRVDAPATSGRLSVPRGAVLSTGERSLVFLKRHDGKLEPRVVVLGRADDDRVQVLGGLALGDTVVSSATFLVDAESNLASALGGMGDMPGMDMTSPTVAPPPAARLQRKR